MTTRDLTQEPPGDTCELHKMRAEALLEFAHLVRLHPVRVARAIRPECPRPKGHVTATKWLGAYAENYATMLACEKREDKVAAKIYRHACDVCLRHLPMWAI